MEAKDQREMFINFHIEVMKQGLITEGTKKWKDKYEPKIRELAETYYDQNIESFASNMAEREPTNVTTLEKIKKEFPLWDTPLDSTKEFEENMINHHKRDACKWLLSHLPKVEKDLPVLSEEGLNKELLEKSALHSKGYEHSGGKDITAIENAFITGGKLIFSMLSKVKDQEGVSELKDKLLFMMEKHTTLASIILEEDSKEAICKRWGKWLKDNLPSSPNQEEKKEEFKFMCSECGTGFNTLHICTPDKPQG